MPAKDSQIRVMIVEDSITARTMLRKMVESEPDLKVVETARDPYDAVEKMKGGLPDVMLLDIEMPRMDGLTFLRRIMSQHPMPVVICSNHTPAGSDASMKALEMGAVEVLSKSDLGAVSFSDDARMQVCDVVRAAAHARVKASSRPAARPKVSTEALSSQKKLSPDEMLPARKIGAFPVPLTPPLIGIGASTGGTEALANVLKSLPADCPPIVIVQHMPEKFTESFAKRLDKSCTIAVKEAEDGDELIRGRALIAAGHSHLLVKRNGRNYVARVMSGPPISRHRPSVDVLFRSLSVEAGQNAMGIIMTGMGDDGATCLGEMRNAGSVTIAQDEASCVVYGMPRAAVERGSAQKAVPLEKIAMEIMAFDQTGHAAANKKG